MRTIRTLSKRTGVYGLSGYIDNNAHSNLALSGGPTPAALPNGVNQTGVMLGMFHRF
ncbi:hypothetical protein [Pigmentiphaga sp.]|uniref:hypothetical protein n=1 Tax=Pigmentiphaga sp. TaxID=1977564 RepID=UPI0025E9F7E2|nr:hypothetical protein [Pigmentiphaga sp.]MBX6319023.1 hypothetical protein [Pigmentiphaga sp.]